MSTESPSSSDTNTNTNANANPTIKHLILSGGGPSIFRTFGAFYHLEESGFVSMKNIQTIFGTSAGAIFGAILCLGFDQETITNYVINRPWHEAFPVKVAQIMDIYKKKGLYDHKAAETMFKPLLCAKDLPLTITMKELYEYSNIELHMYSLELNSFKIEDISYKTHPDLPLLHAVIMTSTVPTIFVPFCIDDKCYIDGGVLANYPLRYCLEQGHKKEEVLGLKFVFKPYVDDSEDSDPDADGNDSGLKSKKDYEKEEKELAKTIINESSNVFEFLMGFLGKVLKKIGTDSAQQHIPYEVCCETANMSFHSFKIALSSLAHRKELYKAGTRVAKKFLSTINFTV
jgi:predicted acylesterase/phospholipase RssA